MILYNFIHIPKTGGVSVWHSIGKGELLRNRLGGLHRTAQYFADKKENLSFTVFRDPLQRLMSTWKFISQHKTPSWEIARGCEDFNKWVIPKLSKTLDKGWEATQDMNEDSDTRNPFCIFWFAPQVWWIRSEPQIQVSIFTIESIFKELNIPPKILNKSLLTDPIVSPETESLVNELYTKDKEVFLLVKDKGKLIFNETSI